MSANDYYYGSNRPLPTASPSPYASYTPQTSHSTPAPPYSAEPDLGHHAGPKPSQQQQLPQPYPVSPFDTPFDDNVYPADSRHGAGMQQPAPAASRYNQDTSYYGQPGRQSPDDRRYNTEDIPLQNRPGSNVKDNAAGDPVNAEDHVYDRPESSRAKKSKRGHVRLGQLGMLGSDRKRIPWVVYLFSIVQVAVFIGEIVKNATLTGSPIMIRPQFNPMIGPSTYVLINMGARYVACMHNIPEIQGSDKFIRWPCPNSTSLEASDPSNQCTLSDLCGFGGVPNPLYGGQATIDQSPQPNQWFRFITPIFMHAGLVHIGFNLLLQLTMGKEMEMAIGSIRFFLVYMSAGIFGFVMGGNFAANGVASTGASGSLFGVIALTLLDLLYSWSERRNPVKDLMFIFVEIVISFVLGLLPGLDNFSHIGGFLMGLGLGVCVLHSPNSLRKRLGSDTPYAGVQNASGHGPTPFLKNPVGFFKGRKPLWWAWWIVRAAALLTVIIVFIVLLNNFYVYHNTCGWCKYLSCLPVNDWCEIGSLRITDV